MKSDKSSGFQARVKRWTSLMNVALLAGFVGVLLIPPASNMTLVAKCIPMNNRFAGPLEPLISELVGGIGGLIPGLVSILLIVAIIMGLIKVFKNEDISRIIKWVIAIPAVVLIVIAVLIIWTALLDIVNAMCSSSPF